MQDKTKPDTFVVRFLAPVLRDWPTADIKFLDDVKQEIKARIDARTGRDGFEFIESDDSVITEYMASQPGFVRATFGSGREISPSWKRGLKKAR